MARRSATAKRTTDTPDTPVAPVGPPMLLLALGFVSVIIALALVPTTGVTSHLIGYATGAIVPVFIIGLVRRVDLQRRQSPHYVSRSLLRQGLLVLALAAMVVAVLHVWPIATDLAS